MRKRSIVASMLIIVLSLVMMACSGGDGSDGSGGGDGGSTEPQVQLNVSSFGEGSVQVVGDSDALDCSASNFCSGAFDEGSTVVLNAQPSEGWTFDSWQGCPDADGTHCTVTMGQAKMVGVSYLSIKPLEIHNDVIFLTETEIDTITSYNEETGVIMMQAGTDISDYTVGTVLVSQGSDANPIFFARRIQQVLALAGSPVMFDTQAASLEDIIESGTWNYKDEITNGQSALALSHMLDKSNLTFDPIAVNVVVYDSDGNYDTRYDQVKLTGSINLSIRPDFAMKFELLQGLTEFRAMTETEVHAKVKVIAGGEVPFIEGEPVIAPVLMSSPIPVGPIVIVPMVEIRMDYSVSVSATIEPSVNVTAKIVGGAHYVKGVGWRDLSAFDLTPAIDIGLDTISFEAETKAGPKVVFSTKLYGIAGPEISTTAYGGVELFSVLPPQPGCLFDHNTYLGAKGNFGGRFSILGKSLKYEADLFDTKWYVEAYSGGCSDQDSDYPTDPAGLAADFVASTEIGLSWDEATDDTGVKAYHLYRDHQLVTSQIDGTTYVDKNLIPGRSYCYYVMAEDVTAKMSIGTSNTVCATTPEIDDTSPSTPGGYTGTAISTSSIELSWSDATDNVGVAGYAVYDNTDTDKQPVLVKSVEQPTTILTGLLPNTQYCFLVSAIDAAGNLSEPTSQICITTLEKNEGRWTIFLGCQDREYNIEDRLDLDEEASSIISISSPGQDYNGSNLVYSINGSYNSATKLLDADISWTFENNSSIRRDMFTADLSTGDSGDVNMTQVQVTGCDGKIRFIKDSECLPQSLMGNKMEIGENFLEQ